ncbi:hypothetical protein BB560_003817 [Smittium megazygosporum]|uniref:Uncharacterized protein n=1 Tax=Smittium megazygosporum TaxID=133381 RepID=A0A2T9ZAX6_9FUNG|nr:hypothetical protein BB560_003817 [Smittium megazygosporum]
MDPKIPAEKSSANSVPGKSFSTKVFIWTWEESSSTLGNKTWSINALLAVIKDQKLLEIENLLSKYCDGLRKCVQTIEDYSFDTSLQKQTSSSSSSMKRKYENLPSLQTTNSKKLKLSDSSIPLLEASENHLNTRDSGIVNINIQRYQFRIFRLFASMCSILISLQESSEKNILPSIKLHSQLSDRLAKTFSVVLYNKDSKWNNVNNIGNAVKCIWKLLYSLRDLPFSEMEKKLDSKQRTIIPNPRKFLEKLFLLPSYHATHVLDKNVETKYLDFLFDSSCQILKFIELIEQIDKESSKLNIIQVYLIGDMYIFKQWLNMFNRLNFSMSNQKTHDMLEKILLSLSIIIVKAISELDSSDPLIISYRQTDGNLESSNKTSKPSNKKHPSLPNDISSQKNYISLSVWQKATHSCVSFFEELLEHIISYIDSRVEVLQSFDHLSSILSDPKILATINFLNTLIAYANKYSRKLSCILFSNLSLHEDTREQLKGAFLENPINASHFTFNRHVTIPSSLRNKNKQIAEPATYSNQVKADDTQSIQKLFTTFYSQFLNKRNIEHIFSSPVEFSLDDSIFNLETGPKFGKFSEFICDKWFRYAFIASSKIANIFLKLSVSKNCLLLLPLKLLKEELETFGQLSLFTINYLVISLLWEMDLEEKAQHQNAKILSTTSDINQNIRTLESTNVASSKDQNVFIPEVLKPQEKTRQFILSLPKKLDFCYFLVSTLNNWTHFHKKRPNPNSENKATLNNNSSALEGFIEVINVYISEFDLYIFTKNKNNDAGRLIFSILIDLLWISSQVLYDERLFLEIKSIGCNLDEFMISSFKVLKRSYNTLNVYSTEHTSICAFQVDIEEYEKNTNSYKNRSLDAIISGKIRRWCNIFESANEAISNMSTSTEFNQAKAMVFLNSVKSSNQPTETSTRKQDTISTDILIDSLYYILHGCIKWLSKVSSASQLFLNPSSEWEFSCLQRMPRICGKLALKSALSKILNLAFDDRIFFGAYVLFVEQKQVNIQVSFEHLSENSCSFVDLCSFVIYSRINKSKDETVENFFSLTNENNPEISEHNQLEDDYQNFYNSSGDDTNNTDILATLLTTSNKALFILDGWSLDALKCISSLLGAKVFSLSSPNKRISFKDSILNSPEPEPNKLDMKTDSSFFIDLEKLGSNTKPKAFKTHYPISYLLIQTLHSLGLSKLSLNPNTFPKQLLSLKHIQKIFPNLPSKPQIIKTMEQNTIEKSLIWLGITESVISNNFLRSNIDYSQPDQSDKPYFKNTDSSVNTQIKFSEKLLPLWWCTTFSVSSSEILNAIETNRNVFLKGIVKSVPITPNKKLEILKMGLTEFPTIQTLSLMSNCSKSIYLSTIALNSLLSLYSHIQFDQASLLSFYSYRMPFETPKNNLSEEYANNNLLPTANCPYLSSTYTLSHFLKSSVYNLSLIPFDFNQSSPKTYCKYDYSAHSAGGFSVLCSTPSPIAMILDLILKLPRPRLFFEYENLYRIDSVFYNHLGTILEFGNSCSEDNKKRFYEIIMSEYANNIKIYHNLFKKSISFLKKSYILNKNYMNSSQLLETIVWVAVLYSELYAWSDSEASDNFPSFSLSTKHSAKPNSDLRASSCDKCNKSSSKSSLIPEFGKAEETGVNSIFHGFLSKYSQSPLEFTLKNPNQTCAIINLCCDQSLVIHDKENNTMNNFADFFSSALISQDVCTSNQPNFKRSLITFSELSGLVNTTPLKNEIYVIWNNQHRDLVNTISSLFKTNNGDTNFGFLKLISEIVESKMLLSLLNVIIPSLLKCLFINSSQGFDFDAKNEKAHSSYFLFIESCIEFTDSFTVNTHNDILLYMNQIINGGTHIRDMHIVASLIYLVPSFNVHGNSSILAAYKKAFDPNLETSLANKLNHGMLNNFQLLPEHFFDEHTEYTNNPVKKYLDMSLAALFKLIRTTYSKNHLQRDFKETKKSLISFYNNLKISKSTDQGSFENDILFAVVDLPSLVAPVVYFKNISEFQSGLQLSINFLICNLISECILLKSKLDLASDGNKVVIMFHPNDEVSENLPCDSILVLKNHNVLGALSPFFSSMFIGNFSEGKKVTINESEHSQLLFFYPSLLGTSCYIINFFDVTLSEFIGILHLICLLLGIDLYTSYTQNIICFYKRLLCICDLIIEPPDEHAEIIKPFCFYEKSENCFRRPTELFSQSSTEIHGFVFSEKIQLENEHCSHCKCAINFLETLSSNFLVDLFKISSRLTIQTLSDFCSIFLMQNLNSTSHNFLLNYLGLENTKKSFISTGIYSENNEGLSHNENILPENHITSDELNGNYYCYTEKWEAIPDLSWIPKYYSALNSITPIMADGVKYSTLSSKHDNISYQTGSIGFRCTFPMHYHSSINTETIRRISDSIKKDLGIDGGANKGIFTRTDLFNNLHSKSINETTSEAYTTVRMSLAINGLFLNLPVLEYQAFNKEPTEVMDPIEIDSDCLQDLDKDNLDKLGFSLGDWLLCEYDIRCCFNSIFVKET